MFEFAGRGVLVLVFFPSIAPLKTTNEKDGLNLYTYQAGRHKPY